MTSAALTVGIHGFLLLLIVSARSEAQQSPTEALATFDVSDPGPPAPEPTTEPQPREVEPTPPQLIVIPPPALEIPTLSPMVVSLLERADTQAAGGCDLTYPVQVALQTSPEVQRELPRIPEQRRSVANAVAIWNQTWFEPDEQLSQSVVLAIRGTVAATVAAASDACRLQLQGGPRLIYLPGIPDTTVLALGSGEWTWQQVADSASPDFMVDPSVVAQHGKDSQQFGPSSPRGWVFAN
jgi:hypothetical protein